MQPQVSPQSSTRRGTRVGHAILTLLCWLCTVALAVLVFLPASGFSQWLSTRLVVAQLIAFPLQLGIVLLLLAVGVSLALYCGRRTRPGRGGDAALLHSLWVPILLCAASGAGLIVFPVTHYDPGERPIYELYGEPVTWRIVTLNSQDTLTRADLDHLISVLDPDVIVLPEASPERLPELTRGTAFADKIYQPREDGYTHGRSGNIAPTSVLVHKRMPDYEQVSGPVTTFGTVKLANAVDAPDIVAIHTAPPVPGYMGRWRADLNRVLAATDPAGAGDLVVAGDFNATLRHGSMAGRTRLVDAAQLTGNARAGTWPALALLGIRTPIDHILVTDEWSVLQTQVRPVGDADHLAVVAELTRVIPPQR